MFLCRFQSTTAVMPSAVANQSESAHTTQLQLQPCRLQMQLSKFYGFGSEPSALTRRVARDEER